MLEPHPLFACEDKNDGEIDAEYFGSIIGYRARCLRTVVCPHTPAGFHAFVYIRASGVSFIGLVGMHKVPCVMDILYAQKIMYNVVLAGLLKMTRPLKLQEYQNNNTELFWVLYWQFAYMYM